MHFDPNNNIVKLCGRGMEMEGQGQPERARSLFLQAWGEATNDFEKFIAAHYVARHQQSTSDKLVWDQIALRLALNIQDSTIEDALPSLYLNIAKCYEDLGDVPGAKLNYELALSFVHSLTDDGYGVMIKSGIMTGLKRVTT